jgi:putative ATP-binding cassette transporter
MRALAILLRNSHRAFVLAVLAATASGFASAALLALINHAIGSKDLTLGRPLAWAFGALCLLVPLSRFGSSAMLISLGQKAVFDFRIKLCQRIFAAPLRRLEEVGAHRLMAALTQDIGSMATALTDLPILCMNGAVVAGSLAYLGWLSWRVSLALLVFMAVGIACYQIPTYWGKARQRRAREVANVLYQQYRATTEGVKELKLHGRRRRAFLDQLVASSAAFRRLNVAARSIFAASASVGQALVFIAVGLVLLVVPGTMTVDREVVTGFALVLLYLMNPLQGILDMVPDLSQAIVAIGNVEQLGLSLTAESGGAGEQAEAGEPAGACPAPAWQEIELVGVSHAYEQDGDERGFTLGPLDLKLRRGELVFVIGGNGSGKTTLIKLIAGLYTPREGCIRLDGVAVSDLTRERYRQGFSAVFADFFLFQDLLGLDDPQLDARARDFLQQLELGRKVTVENGRLSTIDLSQGQRKRLALLTAYLEDRAIYLFDEWAADQDPVYKEVFYHQILTGLRNRGKTVVVICHDDRYFHVADRLVKLENGKVILDEPAARPSRPHLQISPPATQGAVASV